MDYTLRVEQAQILGVSYTNTIYTHFALYFSTFQICASKGYSKSSIIAWWNNIYALWDSGRPVLPLLYMYK